VLIVSDDRCAVEADLAAGRLGCPCCGVGVLGGWGCARLRVLHTLEGQRRLRPRRGRCREAACLSTHVLLPDVCLARRRDAVEVIGEALVCLAGEAYRPVAERLGVPAETVRDWGLRFRSRAGLIADHFWRWARALDGALSASGLPGSPVLDAVEAIGCCARAASLALGRRAPWSWVAALTAGGLLALEINTSPPWPVAE